VAPPPAARFARGAARGVWRRDAVGYCLRSAALAAERRSVRQPEEGSCFQEAAVAASFRSRSARGRVLRRAGSAGRGCAIRSAARTAPGAYTGSLPGRRSAPAAPPVLLALPSGVLAWATSSRGSWCGGSPLAARSFDPPCRAAAGVAGGRRAAAMPFTGRLAVAWRAARRTWRRPGSAAYAAPPKPGSWGPPCRAGILVAQVPEAGVRRLGLPNKRLKLTAAGGGVRRPWPAAAGPGVGPPAASGRCYGGSRAAAA